MFDLEVVLLHLNQSTGVDPRHERDRETYVNNNPNCLTYSCLVLVLFTHISRCPTCLLYFLQSIQTTYRLFTSVRCVCVRALVYFAYSLCVIVWWQNRERTVRPDPFGPATPQPKLAALQHAGLFVQCGTGAHPTAVPSAGMRRR